MNRKFIVLFFILLTCFGQTAKENWLPISRSDAGSLYLNTEGIVEYNNGDVFVWTLYEHSRPIVIESVNGRIYKTKTYYLFNKELRRYSFQQIIYYDDEGNALKSFSYPSVEDTENHPYRYNYPVFKNTNEEIILSKIIDLTSENNNEEKGE